MEESKINNVADNAGGTASKKSRLNTTQKILIIGFSVIIIGGAVLAYILINKKDTPSKNEPLSASDGNMLVIDQNNLKDVEDLLEDKVSNGMFEINMNGIWNFPDAKSASTDAYIANSHANSKPFYFEVILADTGKTVFKSTVLPVGSSWGEIKLNDTTLKSGSYDAKVVHHMLKVVNEGSDNQSFEEESTFDVAVILNILK